MPSFYIIDENTEDTVETTDNLEAAIQVAREVARQGKVGDMVSILQNGGMAVRQYLHMPDGTVAEQAIAGQRQV